MDQYSNQKYIQMIEQYNHEYACLYNRLIEEQNTDIDNEINEDAIINSVNNNMQEWFQTPFSPEYPGITADMIIDSITDIEEAVQLASYAAIFCDDEIPDRIKIKLGSFGSVAISKLEDTALICDWGKNLNDSEYNENTVIVCSSFIKLLCEWQYFESYEAFILKFVKTNSPNELIADAIRYYLCACGKVVIPTLIDCLTTTLNAHSDLNTAGEYLLIALTDIGKTCHSDEIYSCLKDCFRKMHNKVIGAICIGDYGDSRGVQVLKGWLDRHAEENDRQLISEILSSIKRLGGDISDIQNRLKLRRF